MITQPPPTLPLGILADEVRAAFNATGAGERRLGLGLEAEFIPFLAGSTRRLPPTAREGEVSGSTLLRRAASGRGWMEEPSPYGVPRFRIPGTGIVSFEPGGQLELSTDVFESVDVLVRHIRECLAVVTEAADALGVGLMARGMDPVNQALDIPLWVDAHRFRRQSAHYQTLGPWGRRMMLQSAAVHVNLDWGGRPVRRWWAANRLAPYMVAVFANSPRCEGAESGHRSSRAAQWRRLDPSRTGVFRTSEDPVAAYTNFALEAGAFLAGDEACPVQPFRAHWDAGADLEDWRAHLTTLFPEVRPRRYMELRSFDALPAHWLAVPLVVTAGLLYSPGALAEVERLLPEPDDELLERAGRLGLRDDSIRRAAEQLFDLALRGARELGEDAVGGAALEEAEAFRRRFVARGEDPGHEEQVGDPASPADLGPAALEEDQLGL